MISTLQDSSTTSPETTGAGRAHLSAPCLREPHGEPSTQLKQLRPVPTAAAKRESPASSTAEPEVATPPQPDRLLSAAMWRLAKRAQEGSLTLGEALRSLEPASPLLFCALLALPFCQPVPTMGLSLPFGFGIACIGGSLLIGRETNLPQWLRDRRIPSQFFPLMLRSTARFLGFAEGMLRPRLQWMLVPPLPRIWAMVLIVSAIGLSLPLPVPFSNAFPAISVFAICMGSLKRDGLALAIGLAAFLLALGFMVFLAFAGAALLR